jgi:hypothetical protein
MNGAREQKRPALVENIIRGPGAGDGEGDGKVCAWGKGLGGGEGGDLSCPAILLSIRECSGHGALHVGVRSTQLQLPYPPQNVPSKGHTTKLRGSHITHLALNLRCANELTQRRYLSVA